MHVDFLFIQSLNFITLNSCVLLIKIIAQTFLYVEGRQTSTLQVGDSTLQAGKISAQNSPNQKEMYSVEH